MTAMAIRVGVIGNGNTHSARGFLAREVSGSTVTAVFDAAERAPGRAPISARGRFLARAVIEDESVEAVVTQARTTCTRNTRLRAWRW